VLEEDVMAEERMNLSIVATMYNKQITNRDDDLLHSFGVLGIEHRGQICLGYRIRCREYDLFHHAKLFQCIYVFTAIEPF
jgi:hypothetical protein